MPASLAQIDLDAQLQPGAPHLPGGYPAEQQLPRVHEAGKDHVIVPWDIADFRTASGPDDDGPLVVGVVRLPEEVELVVNVQVPYSDRKSVV